MDVVRECVSAREPKAWTVEEDFEELIDEKLPISDEGHEPPRHLQRRHSLETCTNVSSSISTRESEHAMMNSFYQITYAASDDDMHDLDAAEEDGSYETPLTREIARLTQENMSLNQRLHSQDETMRRMRAQRFASIANDTTIDALSGEDAVSVSVLPRAECGNGKHNGYLHITDLAEFTKLLISDLHVRVARVLPPCLPSNLLFMALRLHDRERNDIDIMRTFQAAHNAYRARVQNSRDLDVLALCLVNEWHLLNLMRQFSGSDNEEWTRQLTETQRQQQLNYFDTTSMREKMACRCTDAYEQFMNTAVRPVLEPKIVPAILLYDSINEAKTKGNAKKKDTKVPVDAAEHTIDDLLQFLTLVYKKLDVLGADQHLMSSVFEQLASWMCAGALNQLMFRKDLCNAEKAAQIKHNVQTVQLWYGRHGGRIGYASGPLEKLIQASQLLQIPKTLSNIPVICDELTTELSSAQVLTLLRHYKPVPTYYDEGPVSADFLKHTEERLQVRDELNNNLKRQRTPELDESVETPTGTKERALLVTHLQPLNVERFVYTKIEFDRVQIPKCLHMDDIAKVM